MKYFIIFLILIGLNANENLEIYKQEVDKLVHYTLNSPSNIYDMFIIQKPIQKKQKKKNKIKSQTSQLKFDSYIKLIAILNNKICLKINKQTRWVKIGEKIDNYKIIKILNNNSIVILYNKKMKILSLNNKNNFKIKVR